MVSAINSVHALPQMNVYLKAHKVIEGSANEQKGLFNACNHHTQSA